MSISILNSISEADKAKLAALLLGGEAAETAKPKRGFAPKNDDWKAGEASYPQKMKLITFGDEKVWNPEGVALTGYWPGGEPLTFGELFTVEDRGGKRHFPVLWTGLTAGEASDIYPVLKALPDRPEADKPKARQPKAARGGFKPKASSQPKADDSDLRGEVTVLKALMQQLIEQQFRQEPAKPVAPSGHSKKPAKPVKFDAELGAYFTDSEAVAKSAKPKKAPKVLKPGDSIWVEINGEAVERFLSADSKRLNATK